MLLTLDRPTVEKLLHHAASAAQLVGQLDDDKHPEIVGQLGDHVDAVVHELTEILGHPRVAAEPDAAAPDDRSAYDGAPMLTAGAGGAQ